MIDLANRRAATSWSPETSGEPPSGMLGAMPETSRILRCPDCHNDKFYVFISDFPWELRTTVYCESLSCDYHEAWSQVKIK